MTTETFTTKERLRFRKLLEVANSTTFPGEKEAAMGAATRLASSHGMSLREAAGMSEADESVKSRPRAHGFRADHGAATAADAMGTWWARYQRSDAAKTAAGHRTEADRVAEEKRRREDAMEDALLRGLDAEERAEAARKAARKDRYVRSTRSKSQRPRPEFVRVLLTETAMSAKEIAAAAGVTIYDVFREKLLMRRAAQL